MLIKIGRVHEKVTCNNLKSEMEMKHILFVIVMCATISCLNTGIINQN